MATKTREEQLAALKLEYERQNEQWARLREQLKALGNVRVNIPRELVARLVEASDARGLN
jgi:hypothetical protein